MSNKFTYKLLENNSGIIITRNPQIVEDDLDIEFKGAPENAMAVFEFDGGIEIYRPLSSGECSISFPDNEGEVKVSVTLLNKSSRPRRWRCEELKFSTTSSGEMLITPNDMNLPDVVTELKLENEQLRNDFKKLSENFVALREKFDNMMEGYDLT